jgi:hypothetical protein
VYLHNWLVHSAINQTPYEAWHGRKPDVTHLKLFGARVCVKRTGSRRCKLDRHDFTGIFLGYTATDQNILYLDLDSGIVKSCHHAIFDEAWYLQPTWPPAAQLLYDLGLESEIEPISIDGPLDSLPPNPVGPTLVPWPPPLPHSLQSPSKWKCPQLSLHAPLPLRITAAPTTFGARTARVKSTAKTKQQIAVKVVSEYSICADDMAMVYISPNPFYDAFEEELDLQKFDLAKHRTAGLNFLENGQRLILASIDPGTPASRIARWRTRICGAWLIKIDGTQVTSIAEVQTVFQCLSNADSRSCSLLFTHSKITPDISSSRLPIMSKQDFSQLTHNQLNNRVDPTADVAEW